MGISEIINSVEQTVAPEADTPISEIDKSGLDVSETAPKPARRPRGRPPGSGRKHAPGSRPKTIRGFSELAEALLSAVRLSGPEFLQQGDAEIVEEALVRYARSLSNRNPRIEGMLRRAGR